MTRTHPESTATPLRAQEEAACHAWREWPVLLELRRKELLAHRGKGETTQDTTPGKEHRS